MIITLQVDEELLRQLHAVGYWMAHHPAGTGRMPTWEEAVLFCVDAASESLQEEALA